MNKWFWNFGEFPLEYFHIFSSTEVKPYKIQKEYYIKMVKYRNLVKVAENWAKNLKKAKIYFWSSWI